MFSPSTREAAAFGMGKLVFRYGAMNSAKTAALCMMAHNYKCKGLQVVIVKPAIDTRFEQGQVVWSRTQLLQRADVLATDATRLNDVIDAHTTSLVLVDEVQFLTPAHIDQLRGLTAHTTVICYGLRTDYRGRLFPATTRLFELADTLEEVKTPCTQCMSKGIINAKYTVEQGERVIVKTGDAVIELGAEEKYCALCWHCWMKA
jgi:thymidine kinase